MSHSALSWNAARCNGRHFLFTPPKAALNLSDRKMAMPVPAVVSLVKKNKIIY
jgi:hypothetical protein